ncbi:MAG: hypothetical protein NCW75_13270 [Phycisphaera sp.]|nr:MAG: hypothetical protein NCW75_13270 [Phycisphaera sp.]
MAKLFYSMEETTQKLGKSEEEVMELVDSNRLSKFVDGDKLIFKVDQVDMLADGGEGDDDELPGFADDSGLTSGIGLEDSDDSAIGFADDDSADIGSGEAKEQTGISIFDADEVEEADAAAQTQMSAAPNFGMDTAADPAASGSGLLDMTREADDTSLGADLLEDFGMGDGEGSTVGEGVGAGGGALFEDAGTTASQPTAVVYAEESLSPGASMATMFACFGLFLVMAFAFALIVSITTGAGVIMDLIDGLSIAILAGAMAGVVLVLAIIGGLIGKMTS